MQATLDRDRAPSRRRKLYIRLRLEIGMRPVSDPHAEPRPERPDPLERAYRQQRADRLINAEREAAFRRLRLG